MYRHRQSAAPLLRAVFFPISILLLVLMVITDEEPAARLLVLAVMVVVGLSAWSFSSLTITVDSERLHWYFGPGLFRGSVLVREIQRVEPTRTSLLAGWGIHWTPRGWLYNVAGFDALWVHLRGRKGFLLGTDEPEDLAAAIEQARAAPPAERHTA